MKYHLYFHNDFDGVASAAVMLNFLRGRGDDIASFTPLEYSPELKKKWPDFKFREPFIILDFLYHPRASWWFDHHLTTFVSKKWQKTFINRSTHRFDLNAKSSCGILFSFLRRKFKYNPPAFIRDLVRWADLIDSASYTSARQAVEITEKNQPVGLALFLDEAEHNQSRKRIVEYLAAKPVSQVVKSPGVRKWLEKRSRRVGTVRKVLKKVAVLKNKVLFVDDTKTKLATPRYLGYFLYPQVPYVITLDSVPAGFHISVGKNPWLKKSKEVNIGKLLSKYGGGGHKNIGGMERKSKSAILKIVEKVIEYLNRYG